jgi:hypothetical protein
VVAGDRPGELVSRQSAGTVEEWWLTISHWPVGPVVDEGVAGRHLLLHPVMGQRERVEAGVDGVPPVEDRDELLGDDGLWVARQQVREVVDDAGTGGADQGDSVGSSTASGE